MRGALPVWQLVMVAKEYGMEVEKTAAHFCWPLHRVRAGFQYYEAFPEEIDRALEGNRSMTYEKLKAILPQLEVFEAFKGEG